MRITRSLKTAVAKIERLEKFTKDALTLNKRDGRLPNYSKLNFVTGLANLWRIMTGKDASKDLSSPFASFVSAAWASLGKDLPEISWDSQIRRRRDTLSAGELVSWVDKIRRFPVAQFRLAKKHGLHPELPLRFSAEEERRLFPMEESVAGSQQSRSCGSAPRGWGKDRRAGA